MCRARIRRPTPHPSTRSKASLARGTRRTAGMTEIWGNPEYIIKKEGTTSPDALARNAVLMVTLPADLNLYQAVALP